MDDPNRPVNRHPGEHFRAEMTEAANTPERVTHLVHLAIGAAPPGLAGEPPNGPEEAGVRAEARAELLAEGWLTEAELGALPAEEAAAVARRRFRERPGGRAG